MTWGELDPGRGFRVANTKLGDLWISGYALVRYINQLPASATYVDHLGRTADLFRPQRHRVSPRPAVLSRLDVSSQARIQHHACGRCSSNQLVNIIGSIGYRFPQGVHARRSAVDGMPGIRSLVGSHPYWLAPDRTMAEEFVRPGFTSALIATGEVASRPVLQAVLREQHQSARHHRGAADPRYRRRRLHVVDADDARSSGRAAVTATGRATTDVATRFGISSVRAREAHYTPLDQPPGSTQIRLADGTPLFNTGALATNVTLAERDLLDPVRRRGPEISRLLRSRPSTTRAGSTTLSATVPSP